MELPHFCKFCERAIPLVDDSYMLCRKFGLVKIDYICQKFLYDPLKHVPTSPIKLIIPDGEELVF